MPPAWCVCYIIPEHSDKLLVQLLGRDGQTSAAEPGATDPAIVAAVAADWDAALARLAAGEPLVAAPAAAPESLGEDPDDDDDADDGFKVWEQRDGTLVTNWPPPHNFAGEEWGAVGSGRYRRTLAPDEAAGLARAEAADAHAEAARLERRRRRFFGLDDASEEPPVIASPDQSPPTDREEFLKPA